MRTHLLFKGSGRSLPQVLQGCLLPRASVPGLQLTQELGGDRQGSPACVLSTPSGPRPPCPHFGPLFGVITRRQLDLGSLAPSNRWALRSQNPSERETPAELPGGGSDKEWTRPDPRKTGPGQGGCEADCCDNPPGSGVTEAQRRKATHSPAPRSNVEEFRDLQSREGGRRVTMKGTSLGQSRTFLGQSPWRQRRGCSQVGTILGNLEAQGVSWGQGSSQVAT